MAKRPYQTPGQRTRYEYVLTGRGWELFPLMVSLMEFGLLMQGDSQRLELIHGDGCRASIVSQVRCARGHVVPAAHTEARIKRRRR